MKKILLFIGIVLLLSFQVFSVDYNCDGDIILENYESVNNININNNCYAIRFVYENINDTNVLFNLINNGNNGESPFLIYDNSDESDYETQLNKPFEFKFKNFQDVYFKYGSDYPLITSDYINRNKFIGDSNLNARIEIENSVESGQKYFISGSFSDFNDIDVYFENFGTNNEMGEYRVFFNNINNINVYVDTNNQNSNEKILLIKDNVNNIELHNDNQDEYFSDYRVKIISFEDFMSAGLDTIYLKNYVDIVEKEDINKEDTQVDNSYQNGETLTSQIKKVYEENVSPLSLYLISMIIVFMIVWFIRQGQSLIVSKPRNTIAHILVSIIPVIAILYFTKNSLIVMLSSFVITSGVTMFYYRKDITQDKLKQFSKYVVFSMILVVIIYFIWNWGVLQ